MKKQNRYYRQDLINFYKFNIPSHSDVLEIGFGRGSLLNNLKPRNGVYIDLSSRLNKFFKKKYLHLKLFQGKIENINLKEKFEYIIIPDTLTLLDDIQEFFKELRKFATPKTRIIINFYDFLWLPLFKIAEKLGLKKIPKHNNWLNADDLANLLSLENFEIIKNGKRFLFPIYIPLLSKIFNKFLANLPFLNKLCLINFIIAKPLNQKENSMKKVSVVVPARNEKGNIENLVKRLPKMGKHMEIIFIEGHSKDKTFEEIQRVAKKYQNLDIKYFRQAGRGKADAVRKGFAQARGEILIILDADLTVPPEDLPKFYDAIASGKGEFINGSRLVYPLEKQAMKILNILGNKFFSIMFSWLLNQKIKDTLCGTKVISKKNYEKISANRSYFGDFDPFGDFDLIFGAAKLNLKFIEIPIRYKARQYGETNISRFTHGWLLLKMTLFAMNKIKFV